MAANSRSTVAAILVAAGSGQRLGAGVPKAFVEVAGRSLLARAFTTFAANPAVEAVVVAAPASHADMAAELTRGRVVVGGDTRQDSVAAALAALPASVGYVLVHDVARPFVPMRVIDDVIAALHGGALAVVPIVSVHDTVRRIRPEGTLDGIVDRSSLAAVQTPQGFRRDVLVDAHERAGGFVATDDAALVEALGLPVVAVAGADEAFKITTAADLARAEALVLGSASQPAVPGGMP
jgi:2-C-methyl-D-erythritol 4-phosphate cytidylyltransferase